MEADVKVDLIKEGVMPKGTWLLDVQIGEERKQVPVFHCREDAHKLPIARMLADSRPAVAFGSGLYGLSVVIDDPRRNKNHEAHNAFLKAKSGRSGHAKIPLYMQPKNVGLVVDFEKIQPDFRKLLRDRTFRDLLWERGAAFHLIMPALENAYHIHNTFITTSEDLKAANKPVEQMVNVPTVSVFWWHDPDWDDIANMVTRFNPYGLAGISSFNAHGEQPAYCFDDVIKFIYAKKICPFDFVVRDEIGEALKVESSHPQFRVPLVGEPPEWIVVRHGSISIDGWLKETNSSFGARVLESATVAVRSRPAGEILDDLVLKVRDDTIVDYRNRHPHRSFFDKLNLFPHRVAS